MAISSFLPRVLQTQTDDDDDDNGGGGGSGANSASSTSSSSPSDGGTGTCQCTSFDEKELSRPQTVQMLSMGGPGAYLDFIANRFRSRASLYKNRTGHTVETIGLGDDLSVLTQEILADVDAQVYDGYVFLPFLAGSLLDKGGLADLTEFVRNNDDIDWPDIFPFNRDVQSVFDNSVRLLPCDGDVHSMYYRKDLFEQYNIQVPRTWDEVCYMICHLIHVTLYIYLGQYNNWPCTSTDFSTWILTRLLHPFFVSFFSFFFVLHSP